MTRHFNSADEALRWLDAEYRDRRRASMTTMLLKDNIDLDVVDDILNQLDSDFQEQRARLVAAMCR